MANEPKKHQPAQSQPPLQRKLDDDGERRAAERRAQEAKAREQEADAVQKQIAEAKAAETKVESDVDAKLRVASLVAELRAKVAVAKNHAAEIQDQLRKVKEAAGNLEGAIITAGDVVRHDPKRALESLTRAAAAFEAFKPKA